MKLIDLKKIEYYDVNIAGVANVTLYSNQYIILALDSNILVFEFNGVELKLLAALDNVTSGGNIICMKYYNDMMYIQNHQRDIEVINMRVMLARYIIKRRTNKDSYSSLIMAGLD